MSLALEMSLARRDLLAGESAVLSLTIKNTGSAPVSFPDPQIPANPEPRYTLLAPGESTPRSFASADRVRGPRRTAANALQRALEPGQTFTAQVPLGFVVDYGKPGEYRLAASLGSAVSNELVFTVEPLRPESIAAGVGVGAAVVDFAVTLVHASERSRCVVNALYGPPRHTSEPPALSGILRESHVLEGKARALATAASFDRGSALFDWSLVRDARGLAGVATGQAEAVRLDLDPDLQVIEPPLLLPGHELFVFLRGSRTLALARLRDPDRARGKSPAMLWQLDARPLAAGSALAPPGEPQDRHVAWVSERDGKPWLSHARCVGEEPPSTVNEWPLEGVRLVPGAPAVTVEPRFARIGVVVTGVDEPERAILLEALVARGDEKSVAPAPAATATVPGGVRAAWLAYLARPGRASERAWLLEGADGQALRPTTSGVRELGVLPRPFAFALVPEMPLVVHVDPARGVKLRQV